MHTSFSPVTERDKRDLRRIVGREFVVDSPEALFCYSYDASDQQGSAELVVSPHSTEEVSQIMALAHERQIPVYPRGSASGLTGGCVPVQGGIVLDLLRMNRILEINPESMTARVQPGVILEEFQQEVERRGLFYPPDPSSRKIATIGGTVAECAGSLRGTKYGVTRDYVLALEAVLPGGKIIHTGASTTKSVTGYDLTRLLVGSEGTLAVITETTLKLLPLPEAAATAAGFFSEVEKLVEAALRIMQLVVPRCLEFLDKLVLEALRKYDPELDWPRDIEGALLAELDGTAEAVAKEVEIVAGVMEEMGAVRVIRATEPEEAEKLWSTRRSVSPALYSLAPVRLNEDVCVPRGKILELLRILREIAQRYSLTMSTGGHIGDGNFHAILLLNDREGEEMQRAERALEEIFRTAVELGGTLSGEHGIGTTKAKYLHLEVKPFELELMKNLKRLLDPKGILNPGKLFVNKN